jgi:hypothetical protein
MNLGLENKKKTMWAAALGAVLIFAIVYQLGLFSSAPPPPPPAAPVIKTLSTIDTHAPASPAPAGKPAEPVAHTAAQLDPTLRMEGMLDAESLVYGGSGRNIFSTQSAPPPIPKAIAPARPTAPPPPPVYVPPPPPPINLTFFGIEVQKDGGKRAFLVHGDDVFLAAPGDIVERRYKIDSILTNGVVIEDLPNNNTQTIPLVH